MSKRLVYRAKINNAMINNELSWPARADTAVRSRSRVPPP